MQGHEALRRRRSGGSERETEQLGRRRERRREQPAKHRRGHGFFVIRDGQAALGDMKDALRCPAVAARIVEYALADPE